MVGRHRHHCVTRALFVFSDQVVFYLSLHLPPDLTWCLLPPGFFLFLWICGNARKQRRRAQEARSYSNDTPTLSSTSDKVQWAPHLHLRLINNDFFILIVFSFTQLIWVVYCADCLWWGMVFQCVLSLFQHADSNANLFAWTQFCVMVYELA